MAGIPSIPKINRFLSSVSTSGLDPDAKAYIAAVEAADEEALEPAIRIAYDTFIRGCKADNHWSAMKNSCILMGARTLAGALVPLRGAAPTQENLVSGDYLRKTGIAGNGTNKAIDTGRSCIDEPDRNSTHQAVGITVRDTTAGKQMYGWGGYGINGATLIEQGNIGADTTFHYSANGTSLGITTSATHTGFFGTRRASSSSYNTYSPVGGVLQTAIPSQAASGSGNYRVLAGTSSGGAIRSASTNRASFYSFGSAGVDLTFLRARYNQLLADIAAAIP
jgi:hypothetical protein